MKKSIIVLLAALFFASCSEGGKIISVLDDPDTYAADSIISSRGDTLFYRYTVPEIIRQGEKYPLVLFLHGAGERGSDNEKQLTHCSKVFTSPVTREKYPCYALFPQCPDKGFWAYDMRSSFKSLNPEDMPKDSPEADIMKTVMDLVENFSNNNQVDKDRIYVMGLSMGGMATFDIVIRHPDFFAAAVPVCGTVNPERITSAIKTPFRIYHGDADPVVPLLGSRKAYRALKAAGVEADLIEFPGVGHGSWNPAVTDPEFLKWMFKQKK